MGQKMYFIGTFRQKTTSGFVQHLKKYQAKRCAGCPLNGACHKSKGNRTIQVNENPERYKAQVYARLNSERGVEKRKRRCHDVEPVFANIKQNPGFQRFRPLSSTGQPFVGKNLIKVLTCRRRVGKSYLLLQLLQHILKQEPSASVIYIN